MAEVKTKPSSDSKRKTPNDCDQDYVNDTLKAGFLPEGVAEQLKKSPS
jgi:hypothetical protein